MDNQCILQAQNRSICGALAVSQYIYKVFNRACKASGRESVILKMVHLTTYKEPLAITLVWQIGSTVLRINPASAGW
jgi:hypothetical protein